MKRGRSKGKGGMDSFINFDKIVSTTTGTMQKNRKFENSILSTLR